MNRCFQTQSLSLSDPTLDACPVNLYHCLSAPTHFPCLEGLAYVSGWVGCTWLLGDVLVFCSSDSGLVCLCGLGAEVEQVILTFLHPYKDFQFLQATLLLFNILLKSKFGT